ncbi:uncharacterized protein LOC106144700 isoform X2 [Ictidomys tridecemlineatus]
MPRGGRGRGGSSLRRLEGRCAAAASSRPGVSTAMPALPDATPALHCSVTLQEPRDPAAGAGRANNAHGSPPQPGRLKARCHQDCPDAPLRKEPRTLAKGPCGRSVLTAQATQGAGLRGRRFGPQVAKGGSKQHPPPPSRSEPGRGRAPPSPTGRGGLGAAGGPSTREAGACEARGRGRNAELETAEGHHYHQVLQLTILQSRNAPRREEARGLQESHRKWVHGDSTRKVPCPVERRPSLTEAQRKNEEEYVSQCEDTARKSHPWGSRSSPATKSAGILILDFQPPEIDTLFYKSYNSAGG